MKKRTLEELENQSLEAGPRHYASKFGHENHHPHPHATLLSGVMIGVLSTLIIMCSYVYNLINNNRATDIDPNSLQNVIKISPIPTIDQTVDTSNWKTYTNDKYKYQISVPNTWTIIPYSEDPTQADQVNLSTKTNPGGAVIRISVLQNKQDLSLRDFLIKEVFGWTDIEGESSQEIKKRAEVTVDGMIKTQIDGKETLMLQDQEQTYLKANGYILNITLTSEDSANSFGQILSTFKFSQ